MKQQTLSTRLAQVNNRPSGFDYMRLVLAVGVVYAHAMLLTDTHPMWPWPLLQIESLIIAFIVPMFFALSGFLVAGSLERSPTLISFLGLRIFRILPALNVEVILSALILGPLFTVLPLAEYYSDPLFRQYFWNMLGHVQYHLPGVYQSNPLTSVNGQMWTVPYELACYVILSGLALFGIFKRRDWLLIFMLGCYALQGFNNWYRPNPGYAGAGGTTVVMAFIAGLLVHRFRDRLPWSASMAAAAFVMTLVLVQFVPNGIRFSALPLAYFTAYLGLLNPMRQPLILSGDYSYGIYLYAFPIQQAVIVCLPDHRIWYVNFAISLPISAAFACISWWFVEKPVMDRKAVLKSLEDWYLLRVQPKFKRPGPR